MLGLNRLKLSDTLRPLRLCVIPFFSLILLAGALSPLADAALPAADNFNRADENPLSNGGKWSLVFGTTNNLQVVSQYCTWVTAAAVATMYWNADTLSDNQYCQLTYSVFGDGGPLVRVSTSATTYYQLSCQSDGTGTKSTVQTIGKKVAGVFSAIRSFYATVMPGDTVALKVSGSGPATLSFWLNGSMIGGCTDSDIASGSYAGIAIAQYSGTGADCGVDNFEAGNLAGCGFALPAAAVNIAVGNFATNQGTTNSLTVPKNAGFTSGQLLVVSFAAHSNASPVVVPPAGWTSIGSNLTVGNTTYYTGWYVYAGEAGFAFSCNGANFTTAGMVAFNGVNPINPVQVIGSNNGTSGAAANVSSITTLTSGDMLVLFADGYSSANRSVSSATVKAVAMTKSFAVNGASNRLPVSAWYSPNAAIGATGQIIGTFSGAMISWGGKAVALRPKTQEGLTQAVCGNSASTWTYSYQSGAGNTYNFSIAFAQTSSYTDTPQWIFGRNVALSQSSNYTGAPVLLSSGMLVTFSQSSGYQGTPARMTTQSATLTQSSNYSTSLGLAFAASLPLAQTSGYQDSFAYMMGMALSFQQASLYALGVPVKQTPASYSLAQSSGYISAPAASLLAAYSLPQTAALSDSASMFFPKTVSLAQASAYSPIPTWTFVGAFSLSSISVHAGAPALNFARSIPLAQSSVFSGRVHGFGKELSLAQTSGFSDTSTTAIAQSVGLSQISSYGGGLPIIRMTLNQLFASPASFLSEQRLAGFGDIYLASEAFSNLSDLALWSVLSAYAPLILSSAAQGSSAGQKTTAQSFSLLGSSSFAGDKNISLLASMPISATSIFSDGSIFWPSGSVSLSAGSGWNWLANTWRKAYNAIVLLLSQENRVLTEQAENRQFFLDYENRELTESRENRQLGQELESRTLTVGPQR